MLRDVMSAVPLSVAPFTAPWNVSSMDAIWNWFTPWFFVVSSPRTQRTVEPTQTGLLV